MTGETAVVAGEATVDDVDAFLDEVAAVGDEHGVVVQAFDARYVVDRAHLEKAVELATRARERGEAIARDPGVEVLLYAAGRRQIDRALAMGVGEGEGPVAVVVHDPSGEGDGDSSGGGDVGSAGGGDVDAAVAAVEARLRPADVLGDYDPDRVRDFFDVGDAELAATDADLADLVRERVALLVVEK